ncbi:MAG: OsmC family peroxiredoxin [Chloroflexota bacterium]|nr:OsmC family peroxiredoxin [Chloroflexota bacterium]
MGTVHAATATWRGDLLTGSGTVSTRSGVLKQAATSWMERTEGKGNEGLTSPEELLAAAHASCFLMALSSGLAKAGWTPTELEAAASVTFGAMAGGGNGVLSSALRVRAVAPGATPEKLREIAEDAKENCPISKALAGNVALSVEAELG